MTLPAFSQAGTGSAGNPSWPTHAAGDFALLIIEIGDTSGTVATPAGWTPVPKTPIATGAQCTLALFYRFATSSGESAPVISGPVNHSWSVILTWTGVNAGTPIHTSAVGLNSPSVTNFAPGVRTFVNDCLVLSVFAWSPDDAGPFSSAETNATLASLVERYDAGTVNGNGGGVIVIEGAKATLGDVDATQVTYNSLPGAMQPAITIALQPVGVALQGSATKSRAVNTGM